MVDSEWLIVTDHDWVILAQRSAQPATSHPITAASPASTAAPASAGSKQRMRGFRWRWLRGATDLAETVANQHPSSPFVVYSTSKSYLLYSITNMIYYMFIVLIFLLYEFQ